MVLFQATLSLPVLRNSRPIRLCDFHFSNVLVSDNKFQSTSEANF